MQVKTKKMFGGAVHRRNLIRDLSRIERGLECKKPTGHEERYERKDGALHLRVIIRELMDMEVRSDETFIIS